MWRAFVRNAHERCTVKKIAAVVWRYLHAPRNHDDSLVFDLLGHARELGVGSARLQRAEILAEGAGAGRLGGGVSYRGLTFGAQENGPPMRQTPRVGLAVHSDERTSAQDDARVGGRRVRVG